MTRQTVYLDMDGTIYPLYEQPDWLARLRAEDATVFSAPVAMVTEEELFMLFPITRYEIRILTMTPMDASKEYCEAVIKAKEEWLDQFFPTITKRIYRAYGHNKNLAHSASAILIDDNETIRATFRGTAINPSDLW